MHLMWPEVLPRLVPCDLQALVAQLPWRRQAPLLSPPLALACMRARRALRALASGNRKRQAPHATKAELLLHGPGIPASRQNLQPSSWAHSQKHPQVNPNRDEGVRLQSASSGAAEHPRRAGARRATAARCTDFSKAGWLPA